MWSIYPRCGFCTVGNRSYALVQVGGGGLVCGWWWLVIVRWGMMVVVSKRWVEGYVCCVAPELLGGATFEVT